MHNTNHHISRTLFIPSYLNTFSAFFSSFGRYSYFSTKVSDLQNSGYILVEGCQIKLLRMEKLLKPYDKEYMRMAILKHEETFKEQVYELHRLYHLQKILMKSSIGKRRPNVQKQESWDLNYHHNQEAQFNPQRKLDLEQPAAAAGAGEYIADTEGDDGVLEIIDETEIELTLGPTRYNSNSNNSNRSSSSNRRKRGGEAAALTLSDSAGPSSFSSSCSTGSSHTINRKSSFSRRTNQSTIHGQLLPADMASGGYRRSGGSKISSSNVNGGEEQLRQDERLKLPPWLFQVLSLNMT
ncbi:uncharacterized protein LOC126601313 isoform X1 [Malus sylvestris]|uniref:uncharacterized protein LOC126601313 isoform X1 n=2 Tax=Malus sylvestris TaxID=3752 RepID=UPI0021AD4EBB|nr:uncharacterized protein LOC126601313 isoform X1 [Malus sylvestris]